MSQQRRWRSKCSDPSAVVQIIILCSFFTLPTTLIRPQPPTDYLKLHFCLFKECAHLTYPLRVFTQPSKLTEETEHSSHHWVEVTAVARGYGLFRPVELFGCVLDEEHHRFCDGDLREAKTEKSELQTQLSQTLVGVCVCVRQNISPPEMDTHYLNS